MFIFLLGHDIDFGHMEAVNLLSSNKYSEKQIVSFLINIINMKYRNCKCFIISLLHITGLPFHICSREYKQRSHKTDYTEY